MREHESFERDLQYKKFALYGFLKNLQFIDPFILLFFRDEGLLFVQIGTLFSIRAILTNLLEIPAGVFADTFGRRRSMIICFGAYIISFGMFYSLSGFFGYACAMGLFAVGEAFRTGTHKAMILEHLRLHGLLSKKLQYYGHTRAWSQRGSAVSAVLAALLVFSSGNYRLIFLGSIIPYALGLLLMMSYPKELDFSPIEGVDQKSHDRRDLVRLSLLGLTELLRDRDIRRAVLNTSLFEGFFKATKDYIQPIIVQVALSLPILVMLETERRSSVLIGTIYLLIYTMTAFAASRADKVSHMVKSLERSMDLLFLGAGLIAIVSGGLLILARPVSAGILFMSIYVIQNFRKPMEVDYFSSRIPAAGMAAGLSGSSQMTTLFTALAAPIVGLVVDTIGIGPGCIGTGVLMVVASLLFRFERQGSV